MHVIITWINLEQQRKIIRIILSVSFSFGIETINTFIHACSSHANNDSEPKWTKSIPASRLPCFQGTEWTLNIIILLNRYLVSNGGWNQRKLTINNGQASGFRGKIMLKRGLLNKLPYTFNGYFLVNEHNDVRVIKQFLGVPNLRRSTPLYIFMHFLPGISLLTLWRFVAEVRWLFPESRQKKRESGKQRNTEPWRWELNENTAFTEISATCSSFYRKYFK